MTMALDPTAVPFACQDDEGNVDHGAVVKKRAIRCALSRICGVCGQTLARPVTFLGSEDELLDGLFAFPPTHLTCATDALDAFAPLGDGRLGRPVAPRRWALVTTGGFDLVRPARRGDPVLFHPNSVLTTTLR
jgi:hypothetical protein